MITHISGICKIEEMNVLTFFSQTALIFSCITRISYKYTQHYACVKVLPKDTLA